MSFIQVFEGNYLRSGLRDIGLRTEKNPPSNTFSAASSAPTAALSRLLLPPPPSTVGVFLLFSAMVSFSAFDADATASTTATSRGVESFSSLT